MKQRVIDLHEEGFRNNEICEALSLSPGKVAGIIWRNKNPGMYKKNLKNTECFHVPPYRLKNATTS